MELLVEPEFWARWLGIVIIDLSLAGDNALVIAMAVLTLPPRQRLFGMIGGTLGAVVLRIALIAVITQILLIPFLQAVGRSEERRVGKAGRPGRGPDAW